MKFTYFFVSFFADKRLKQNMKVQLIWLDSPYLNEIELKLKLESNRGFCLLLPEENKLTNNRL